MYRVDNIGEEWESGLHVTNRTAYNVTISDQWPAEGFEIDVEFPIVIEELAHAVSVERSWDCSVACRRRWARFPFCRRPSICVSRARLWWVKEERVRNRWSTSFWELRASW